MNSLVMNPTAIQIGDFSIQWYALIIGFGAWLAYRIFKREAFKMGMKEDDILDLVFWGIMIGFLGARVYYVIFRWDYYGQNLLQIFNIRGGGMAIYGGVIAGAWALIYLCRRRQLQLIDVFDAAAPALMLAQAIGRWGNFVNQEAYGGPVSREFLSRLYLPDWLIEQMNVAGTYHHPTFLYESVWNLIGFMMIISIRHRDRLLLRGEAALFYLIWYGLGRALIEGMRTDSLYWGPIRVSQALSIIICILGVVIGLYRRKNGQSYYTENLRL